MYNISLNLIKKHLNIDTEFTEDDDYLTMLSDVAVSTVQRHIDHNLNDLLVDGELPTPILQATLLFIGNMYANRESISFASAQEIPFAYDYLLSLYKDYSKKEENGGTFG